MTLFTRVVALSALAAAALGLGAANADEAIEPEAKALFEAWTRAAGEGESVAFRMDQTMKTPAIFGVETAQTWSMRYAFAPPNKFVVETVFSDDAEAEMVDFFRLMSVAVYSDGEELITHYPGLGVYSRTPAPASMAEWRETQTDELGMMGLDMDMPLPDIFTGGSFGDEYLDGVTHMRLGEETDIGGETVQTVHADSEDGSVTAYFVPGDPPILRRMVYELRLGDQLGLDAEELEELLKDLEELREDFEHDSEMMELLGDEEGLAEWFGGDFVMTLEFDLSDWRFGETLPDELFAAHIPEDHEETDNLDEVVHERVMAEIMAMMPEDAVSELVGAEAPVFVLELLDGGEFDLAAHIGEHVVVLDFWATWCPPCVAALPILDQVTGELADEGVVFYAVNVQEDEETVSGFLTNRELDFPVPMDREGAAAEEYGVVSLPTTVIIGKDGVIEAVHIGLLPNLEERLREELTALAAGESLLEAD